MRSAVQRAQPMWLQILPALNLIGYTSIYRPRKQRSLLRHKDGLSCDVSSGPYTAMMMRPRPTVCTTRATKSSRLRSMFLNARTPSIASATQNLPWALKARQLTTERHAVCSRQDKAGFKCHIEDA